MIDNLIKISGNSVGVTALKAGGVNPCRNKRVIHFETTTNRNPVGDRKK